MIFFSYDMEKYDERIIKGKISLIFIERLQKLNAIKSDLKEKGKDLPVGLTYNLKELALNVDMRPATITDIVNCKALPKFSTILNCLQVIGINLETFGKKFDSLDEKLALNHCLKMENKHPKKI